MPSLAQRHDWQGRPSFLFLKREVTKPHIAPPLQLAETHSTRWTARTYAAADLAPGLSKTQHYVTQSNGGMQGA
jgi:hypothetical protein